MSSEDLSTKLLYPNDTNKPRKEYKDSEIEDITSRELSFFYKK
jgi:hypothetical protein